MRDEVRPVLVGVGQVRGNRERTVAGAREPLELMLDAVRSAAADAGVPGLLAQADSVATVYVASWAYDEPAARVAARIGARPTRLVDSPVGGQWPSRLVEDAAAAIAAGESRVALIASAEALASVGALRKAGVDPVDAGWSTDPGGPPPYRGTMGAPAMHASGLLPPTRVYPLFENALRHARGETPEQAAASAAELYAAFTAVAAGNDAAWNPQVRTAADIAAVGPGNRMICEPYPLAVNAMPHVDQAAAVIVTSLAAAREAGIAPERIVHIRGGAGADDAGDVVARPGFASSAALASVLDRALAGIDPAELDVVEVYSCFPVVPKLIAAHLGLPLTALAGVTGGHNAFGGPLSSYTLHSYVAVAQRLRAGARLALVHGNGGYLTYEHATVLARDPHPDGYTGDPVPRDTAGAAPPMAAVPDGADVTVETATVEYGRDGAPAQGFLIGRTADGARFAVATAPGDTASAHRLSLFPDGPGGAGREIVGRTVRVTAKDGHAVIEEPA
ncbi:acetyl-CoA acetyltransferase [Pseudonocardia sp. GCM10023141]|uniref:acetyl-CoA acetyltransferase n=1 Tax=Pseudonocardia sp. GCM10023141 TaxID=3252653 RepID=UPI003619CB91